MTAPPDAVVIGGGPAGAAAAIEILRAGGRAIVLERDAGPRHKVCGEFLSAEALDDLAALGVPVAALGAAPIRRLRLTAGGRAAEADLPFRAAGLSRARLDAALLDRARDLGADLRRGLRARGYAAGPDGAVVEADPAGGPLAARHVVLATGKSGFAGRRRPTGWLGRDTMLGLKMHFRLRPEAAAALGPAVELHLFRGGCAGLQPVEDGYANLCVTLSRATLGAARPEEALAAVLDRCPALAGRLDGALPRWDRPLAIAGVPYGHLHRPGADPGDPAFHVGDGAAVTASFTGDGLALALAGGRLAGRAIAAGEGPAAFQRRFAARAGAQVRRAMRLQALLDRPALHGPLVAALARAPAAMRFAATATRLRDGRAGSQVFQT